MFRTAGVKELKRNWDQRFRAFFFINSDRMLSKAKIERSEKINQDGRRFFNFQLFLVEFGIEIVA